MPLANQSPLNGSNALSVFVALSFLVLATSGCWVLERFTASNNGSNNSNALQASSTTSVNSNDSSDHSTKADTVECSNEYYPVDVNMVRRYEVTGSGPGKYVLQQKDIAASTFKEERSFESGVVINNNWICTPEGLRTAEFINTGVMKSGKFQMESVKSSGVTIPRVFEAGKEFGSSYDVAVKVKAGPVSADATGTVSIASKVVSVGESITVRGSEYDTTKINSRIKIVITVNGRRIEGADITSSNWYGRGVGLVKQETGGTFGKELVELVSVERQ